LGNLGTGINTQIAQQAALPYQLNLPNYGAMTGQSSQNILSLLQGQVPQDVANQIAQMGAERGVGTGSIGSPNSNSALLRSLGLTSLGLQQQGEGELTGAVQRTPTGQQFNPASFLVSPEQAQESQSLANLYSAAPDPTQNALAQLQNVLLGRSLGNPQTYGNNQGFFPTSTYQPYTSPYAGGQQPLGGGTAGAGMGGLGDYASDQFGNYWDPYTMESLASTSSGPNVGAGVPYTAPPDVTGTNWDQGWSDIFGGGDFGGG
jgi:hypothetical protein